MRPGGVGSRTASNLFFVECTSTGIVLIERDEEPRTVSKAAIGSSIDYNAFLDRVKKTRDPMVLFLIRKAGNDSYLWAAGFAETKYRVRTGKLPIPKDGKTGGTSTEELKTPGNRFKRTLKVLSVNRHAVLVFWVHPNSFNTYLLARKMADEFSVPAGWEAKYNTGYRVYIQEVEVKRLKEPPPKPPDEKPKPRPPRLDPKLD